MEVRSVVDKNHLVLYIITTGIVCGLVAISSTSVFSSIQLSYMSPMLVLLLLVAFLIRSFVGLPLSILIVFVGFKYPIRIAFILAFTGAIISAIPPFVVARHIKTPSGVIGIASAKSETIVSRIGGLRSIVAARISVVPSDVVSYGSGFSNISARTYVAGTSIGWFPVIMVLVTMGNSLQSLSFQSTTLPPEFLISGSLLAILILLPTVFSELDIR
ncbi:TVP38/TMEM64 family protein [Salinibaculum rarum]|uniref:TVP38/TMEM64 family protein n=1 Tax=Salinibaculum rarum TaxID=3058903 RepID=UPI00265ED5C6|nr:VTT domain-containing protein [Salinibaculum sp. KK48]